MNSFFSFILIGSTHLFIDDFLKQEEMIRLIKPEFVLWEELEDLTLDSDNSFKEILGRKNISNMTSFNKVERLIRLCYKEKINLIGIDFPNFGFDNELQKKIKNQEELTKDEEEKLNKIIQKREEYHLFKILEYKEKTSRPLVIILGCWHLREESLLRRKLKNYKIISPIDKNGEVLFEPEENRKIKYGEIVSK